MMETVVLPPSAPAGVHRMRLTSRDEVVGKWEKPAFRWIFQVIGGEHEGAQATRTTATELKPGESLGELMAELLGKQLSVGSRIDLDEPLGKVYDVLLVQGNGNGVVIKKVTPIEA